MQRFSKIWTSKAIKTAKRMWAASASAAAIGRTLGTSRQLVHRKATREGWPYQARPKRIVWTPKAIKTAKRMRAAGDSFATIAAALGVSKSAVQGRASH